MKENQVYSRIIKRATARLLFPSLFHTRSHLLSKPFYSGVGSILMFHRVCPKNSYQRIRNNSGLEVTPEYLEKTILFLLKNNYKIIPIGQVQQILNGDYIRKKFIVFTFDDGYVDNYRFAYPIFKKYGIPFTVYVATDLPDNKAILWWYLLEDLVLKNSQLDFELNEKKYRFSCPNFWEKEATYHAIHNLILNGPPEELTERIRQIIEKNNINLFDKTSEISLTWEQIREMHQDPLVEIGAHTIHHNPLNQLSDSMLIKEMEGSRDKIESMTGHKVEHFCYPFGTQNEAGNREFDFANKCGFKTSTTTRMGNIFPEHRNLLQQLPRITVNEKRDNGNINYFNVWPNGALPCINNKFKRIV